MKQKKLEMDVEFSSQKIENLYNDKLEGIIDLDMYKRMSNRITEETINIYRNINIFINNPRILI